MKRAVVIFCFMLVVLNLVAQTALPDTILIHFYQGGDWREKGVSQIVGPVEGWDDQRVLARPHFWTLSERV
jgi:hypothetical protein